jgi:hypothetical protein
MTVHTHAPVPVPAAVLAALRAGTLCSNQYKLNCPQCTNPTCRTVLNPVKPYKKLRDTYDVPSPIPTWAPSKP